MNFGEIFIKDKTKLFKKCRLQNVSHCVQAGIRVSELSHHACNNDCIINSLSKAIDQHKSHFSERCSKSISLGFIYLLLNFGSETYIDFFKNDRIAMSQLRTNSHTLAIEYGK